MTTNTWFSAGLPFANNIPTDSNSNALSLQPLLSGFAASHQNLPRPMSQHI